MQRLGPYELIETLGSGAMGTVWRARHAELGAVRALKVLALRTPSRRERFRRETEHLARIHHPNVVTIHDAGLEATRGWFAMDLIEGRSLREALEAGPLPTQQALEVADGIAAGLEALHAAGVAHRDLKLENWLFDSLDLCENQKFTVRPCCIVDV
ncbi:MAG TPA: hypothetical protein DEA08_12405, partial [Planctomycetes bacterium]|nr:hypothetical protein [Planctomycetota bacterium]